MRVAGFLLLGLLLCATSVPAQDSEQPDLENVLRDAVQDFVDDRTGGDLGRIRGIEVVRKEATSVELSVELSRVEAPERASFVAYIYDRELGKVREVRVDHDPLPRGDGTATVRVTYTGDGSLYSVGLAVGLVDRDSGRTSSRRKVKFVHEWTGTGTGLGGAGASNLTTRGDSQAEAREARTIALAPARVGDTPPYGATTSSSSTGGSSGSKPPGSSSRIGNPGTDRGTVRAAPPPPPTIRTPSASSSSAGKTATARARPAPPPPPRPAGVDLYSAASRARWSSHDGNLPWNGGPGDPRGYVRDLGTKKLSDGKSYAKVLQTHPAFIDSGHIIGSYKIKIPSSSTRFEAKVGFLPGATASDGVVATVDLRGEPGMRTVVTRRVAPTEGVTTLTGEIPKEWRGKDVTLRLYVKTYRNSKQDWFVWVAPKIK